ncbi:globin domain-containing protein [Roseomonas sp. AR75]|uniref:globin domain-containing protein n=1 Tax=Roseomonas sp. AR75 TaxID=2562311 RepID=UPI0010C02E89|nr:globin domain-containing protein [Roseomonas sp. AR75]
MTALDEDELDLVRASFRALAALGEDGAETFYDRLFAMQPGLRALFPEDIGPQCTKLMSMLGVIVARLHDHAALQPLLSDLARRHVGYGAQPEHYAGVGEALLWTLDHRLGPAFTQAHAAAWDRAYAALAEIMLAALPAPAPSPSPASAGGPTLKASDAGVAAAGRRLRRQAGVGARPTEQAWP